MYRVILGTAALIVILTACGGVSKTDQRVLNDAVATVQPERIGRVLADIRSGSSSGLNDTSPKRIVVITATSPPDALVTSVGSRLIAAGFSHTGETGWTTHVHGKLVTVYVLAPATGQPVNVNGRSVAVPPGASAVVLQFVTST